MLVLIESLVTIIRHMTRWYARVAIQDRGQEIMDGLKLILQAGLKKYHEVQ